MHITVCGHASLLVQTPQQTILIDPIFDDNLLDGTIVYAPARSYDPDRLPALTAVVVTHGHFDHFHPPTLSRLSRELPIVTADDPHVLDWLRAQGFSDVRLLQDWSEALVGDAKLVATPSAHEEPEFGLLVEQGGNVFWHMADAEVTPAMAKTVLERAGHVDLISVKYQPVVRASMGMQRNRGSAFDKHEVIEWLETACVCEPKLAFPYASGLCFGGRHAWFNRYALPLSAEETADLLGERLGGPERGAALQPGDRVTLDADAPPRVERQAAEFVRVVDQPLPRWQPVDTTTLFGVQDADERRTLREQLEALLSGELEDYMQRVGSGGWLATLREHRVVWQLYVHAGDDEPWAYNLDLAATSDFVVSAGEHERANFFSHVSGQSLLEVLRGEKPGSLFWLTGGVRSYEKVLFARDGAIRTLELPEGPEDWPADPLTYFLRYRGDDPQLEAPHDEADTASGERVLARVGESDAVIRKKVLLGLLALDAVAREECVPSDEEILAHANHFRASYGLADEEKTRAWLAETGLSDDEFFDIMREFASISKMQERLADRIAAREPARQKLAQSPLIASKAK